MDAVRKYWHWILFGGIFLFEALVLFVLRENIYVGICDNLDLFITQLKMLSDNNAFFARNQTMPILQNISRDYFPSEFSLYNILYFIFPDIYAYIIGYLLKLVIALFSCILLAKLLLQDSYAKYEKAVVLTGTAFALLPVYPMYAVCFASMPLVLYLVIRIYQEPKPWLFAALFFYPLLSYFSFFGAFILGYILIGAAVLSIRDKKISWSLLLSFVVLFAGFFCFEYRLFGIMFFSDVETIRSTMTEASLGGADLFHTFIDALVHNFLHSNSVHTYFVLPICVIYFIWNTIQYLTKKKQGKVWRDIFYLTVLFILFNSIVYTLYYWAPLRNLVETILPPLKGFQFGRTIYFNTFAWYFAFFIVLKEICDRKQLFACVLGVMAIVVAGGTQCGYSDFYNTCYCTLYKLVKGTEVNQLSYGEFYGASLIKQIKEEIGYTADEGACAYGFHPAMLSYNGITTIDGYCGYYSQEYKESFRAAIAPTLAANDYWRDYYDGWGCRAYLFSASGENIYDFGANAESIPQEILIDEPALKALGCDYIFSRVEITNATEMMLDLLGIFQDEDLPYRVYVYRLENL